MNYKEGRVLLSALKIRWTGLTELSHRLKVRWTGLTELSNRPVLRLPLYISRNELYPYFHDCTLHAVDDALVSKYTRLPILTVP